MINGSNPSNSQSGYSLYTGLSIVRPVAVNPTNEEYLQLTGRECPYPLKYEYIDFDGRTFFPINFLVENQETGFFDFLKILISDRDEISKSGSYRFMNTVGNSTWAKSTADLASNPKMSWFTSHAQETLCEGFDTLYNFLKALIAYSSKNETASWLTDMKSNHITPDALFKAQDLTGLKALISWANKQDHSVGVLYSIRSVENNGETKNYQMIETGNSNKNLFLTTVRSNPHELSEWSVTAFKNLEETQKKNGYSITSREYSTEFTKFNPNSTSTVPIMESAPSSEFSGVLDDVV